MGIRYKLVFCRNNNFDKNDKGPIQIEAVFNRKQSRYLSTGKRIHKSFWNKDLNLVDRKHKNHVKLNQYFRNVINELENFELDCQRDNKPFNWLVLKEYFKTKDSFHIKPVTFNEFCWEELGANTRLAPGTIRHNRVTLNLWDKFSPSTRFDELTASKIKDWDNFLNKQGYKPNYVSKHHKVIVKFINLAIEDERVDFTSNDFPYTKSIKKSYKRTRKDFLRFQELDKIEGLNFTEPQIERAKNRLLLSCYTGLRHSDVNQLSKQHLRFYNEGIAIDLKEMYKTKDSVYYPCWQFFDGKAEKYLRLLGGEGFKGFRSFSDDNKYFKIIAREAGLNRHITFHIGRHSFLTNLAWETNGNVLKVMRYSGVRKIDTALVYIHASEEYYEGFVNK